MTEQPNKFDRAVAFVLGLRPLVYIVVLIVLALCLLTMYYSNNEFILEWVIEVFGATLVFLAVYHIHPQQIRVSMLAVIVFTGSILGWISYLVHLNHILSALLVKLSSGLMLFAALEVMLRLVLNKAKKRELALAQKVFTTRKETVGAIKDYLETVSPPVNLDGYVEALDKLIFPDGPPAPSGMVLEDPEWIEGWVRDANRGKDDANKRDA